MRAIKVFGDDAKKIHEKQHFIAFHYSVEGVDCVELIPSEKCCDYCEDLLKEVEVTQDDTDFICVNEKCPERSC